MSTPEQRRSRRDFWNNPGVIRLALILDWVAGIACTLALLVIGSLNL